jgi:hypothetical protein
MSLLTAIDAWISPDGAYENFYQFVWNVLSASSGNGGGYSYGLDVWGRIVNIPRVVTLTGVPTTGFAEAGDRVGFNQGPFYEAGIGVTTNFRLGDPVYRQLILAKAAYNITDGSTQAINAILMNLFAYRGNCWVTDGRNVGPSSVGFAEAGDRLGFNQGPFYDLIHPSLPANMTLTYTFSFPLQDFEKAIVQSGVLPKPTGVQAFWAFLGG